MQVYFVDVVPEVGPVDGAPRDTDLVAGYPGPMLSETCRRTIIMSGLRFNL